MTRTTRPSGGATRYAHDACGLLTSVTDALLHVTHAYDAAGQAVPEGGMGETGSRQGRTRAWRWTVVTALVTVFQSSGLPS